MELGDDLFERNRRRVGTVVRRKYRLDALLGVGGMGAVFAATHRNGSRAALKVLHPELSQLADIRARFLREGYVANLIAHPGVVRIIDDDDDDEHGTVFLVMDLLDGETVQARWEGQGRRLGAEEVAGLLDRTLEVVGVAHARGIVHRDLKPENLFLTRDRALKVLDFGIARLLDGAAMTRSGMAIGTPAFMPPEQASGDARSADARSDIWSAGAVAYTLLTGTSVHPGATAGEQMVHAATREARPIQAIAPWVPGGLARVVDTALAFNRQLRWQSTNEMREALRAVAVAGPGPRSAMTRTQLAGTLDDLATSATVEALRGAKPR